MNSTHSAEEKTRRRSAESLTLDGVQQEVQTYASPVDASLMRQIQRDPARLAPGQILQLQRLVGNQAIQRMLRADAPAQRVSRADAPAQRVSRADAPARQPVAVSSVAPQVQMLRVDAADTQYEEEADQIADAVVQSKRIGVQRRGYIQRSGGIGPEGGDVDEGMERQIKGATGGGSLPGSVRNVLEPKLGVDLKGVKVHTGAKSAQLNRQLNAKAFTYKNNIFYGGGQSPSDLSLTTHEVVHTMHQGAVHKKAVDSEEQG